MRATFHTSMLIWSRGILYNGTTTLHIGRTTATWTIFVNVHRDINGPQTASVNLFITLIALPMKTARVTPIPIHSPTYVTQT
ncbi:hypothetical protein DPMN_096376 [Dreissena polymorpha]|uniref:Uncharacterized protein n=1 Tax=Dreissena polymorpha TaxID=45954 RepID=A0A9D4LB86_DREPO|nr:hypothetical protein DPMN_096376 [Dreissena polymorpha]